MRVLRRKKEKRITDYQSLPGGAYRWTVESPSLGRVEVTAVPSPKVEADSKKTSIAGDFGPGMVNVGGSRETETGRINNWTLLIAGEKISPRIHMLNDIDLQTLTSSASTTISQATGSVVPLKNFRVELVNAPGQPKLVNTSGQPIYTGEDLIYWNTGSEGGTNSSKEKKEELVSKKVEIIGTAHNVCNVGPHTVKAGSFVMLPLNADKGDLVEGTITESEGNAFDWYIVDQRNNIKFRKKEKYSCEEDGEGEGAYEVKWTVSKDGPWHLILDAYGKQNDREIEVHFWRLSKKPL